MKRVHVLLGTVRFVHVLLGTVRFVRDCHCEACACVARDCEVC